MSIVSSGSSPADSDGELCPGRGRVRVAFVWVLSYIKDSMPLKDLLMYT